jgi:hypothetical protein
VAYSDNLEHMKTSNASHNAGNSRRSFLKKTAMGTAVLANTNLLSLSASEIFGVEELNEGAPWFRNITRWGQINITEEDPTQYDIPWWRKFWKETETQGVVINAGGIVAYYPTEIPLHRPAKYLGGRDIFGELCKAAHEDGIVVFARMDSNRAHEDFYKAHPDWFAIDAKGDPYKAGELYLSCVNSPYYQEHIPAILTEIWQLYKPEGFTDNSWSGLNRDSICYCENCKKSFLDKTGQNIPSKKNWDDKVYKQWIRWNYDRRLEIWDLNNKTTKSLGGPSCTWAGMNSGSIIKQSKRFRNYKEIAKRADIIMLDDQSRSTEGGFQHNAQMGQLIHGLLGWEKLIPESMSLYHHSHGPFFRLASKPTEESRMWMISGIAGGISPWWHMISAYHLDRRMYHTAQPIYKWYKENSEYLLDRQPVANVGLVWSQENTEFYGRDNAEELVELPWRGMTHALLRARIPYIPVHADYIDRDADQFSVLILSNLAIMTDDQMAAVRRFVDRGGSVIATGDTSLYDEEGDPRSDYGLSDLFGAHLITPPDKRVVPSEMYASGAYHTYLRLTPELRSQMTGPHTGNEPEVTGTRHKILEGLEETDMIPYGGLLEPLKLDVGAEVPMTFIPQFPTYPPETAYMREAKTDIPGVILKSNINGGKVVFIPADIDRQYGRWNLPDHGNLIAKIVRWTVNEDLPLKVEGPGLVDCHLYQKSEKLILHIVNLTNPAAWRKPMDELIEIGPLKVKVKLPGTNRGEKLKALVSNQKISAKISNGFAEFMVKSILDHEVIVI